MSSIDDISATITADSTGYVAAMNTAQNATTAAADSMSKSFEDLGKQLDIEITIPLTAMGVAAVSAFNTATQNSALLNAELKATGDAVGYSASQLGVMAENLGTISGFGKQDIMSGVIDSLLKFSNVTGQTFSQAANDATGWAATGTESLQSASQRIGMALQNPIMAFRTLRGSMASLTPNQNVLIQGFMKQGDIAAAQAIILGNLNKAYGSMAESMGATSTPAKEISSDLKDIQENLAPFGGIIEKSMVPFYNALDNISKAFNKLSPSAQEFVVIAGGIAAAIGPALTIIGLLGTTVIPQLAAGFGLVSTAAKFMLACFTDLWTMGFFPLVAALGAVVIAGQLVYDNWKTIEAEAGVVANGIKGIFLAAQGYSTQSAAAFAQMDKDISTVTTSTGTFSASWGNLKNEVSKAMSDITGSVTGMETKVKASLNSVGAANNAVAPTMVPAWVLAFGDIGAAAETLSKTVMTQITTLMDDVTAQLETGGMDWNQALGSALQAIIKQLINYALVQLGIMQALAQAMLALQSLGPIAALAAAAAAIAIVSSMHLAPPAMAKGGVFDSATTVTVGEAGPEVILPVTRLSNGKMGVGVSGGAGGQTSIPNGGGNGMGQNSSSGLVSVAVYLDAAPILKAVSRASRTGKVIIHPSAIRNTGIN